MSKQLHRFSTNKKQSDLIFSTISLEESCSEQKTEDGRDEEGDNQ